MKKYPYIYRWRNNEVRERLYGRRCRIVRNLKMNSIIIEFKNGLRHCVSRFSIVKIKPITLENMDINKEG